MFFGQSWEFWLLLLLVAVIALTIFFYVIKLANKEISDHYRDSKDIMQEIAKRRSKRQQQLKELLFEQIADKVVEKTNKKGSGCIKCHKYNYECAHYMVNDDVWAQSGADKKDKLCLTCLSKMIGRKLNKDDFTSSPINRAIFDLIDNFTL